jgi:hypothetical protein
MNAAAPDFQTGITYITYDKKPAQAGFLFAVAALPPLPPPPVWQRRHTNNIFPALHSNE